MVFASLLAMLSLILYLICQRESKAVLALLEALQTLQALQGRGVGRL
jgi:hypothetical protein